MKIILLQLARLGDVLQTLPAIQGLKKKYPNSEITLVTRKKFSSSAKLSPYIDKIIELPTDLILEPVLNTVDEVNKSESLIRLENWYLEIEAQAPYDLLINLTFSNASTWLATLISAQVKRGVYRALDQGYQIDDLWSQYFFAEVLQKNLNIIHLNDLFTNICGVQGLGWPLDIKSNSYTKIDITSSAQKRIGIQICASTAEKSPSMQTWAKIIQAISSNSSSEFIFFGSEADRSIVEKVIELASVSNSCINLVGKYEFHENFSWIESCNFIISPDTAMVHLASIVATYKKQMTGESLEILEIPMGGVRPEETGPYGSGHHVLYPASASPEDYAKAISEIIYTGKTVQRIPHSKTSMRSKSDRTEINVLEPVNFDNNENVNFFEKSLYLLAEFRCHGSLEDLNIPVIGNTKQQDALETFANTHEQLLKLKKAAEIGSYYCVEMIESAKTKEDLKELMKKLDEVDALLEQMGSINRFVKPAVDWWKISKSCLQNNNLTQLIELTEGSYRVLQQNIDIIIQLMETAVKAAHERAQSQGKTNQQEPISKESKL